MDESSGTEPTRGQEQRPEGEPLSYEHRPARPEAPPAMAGNALFDDTPVYAAAAPRGDAAHEAAGPLGLPGVGDMQHPVSARRGTDGSYVRLTVHVEDGTLTVTDAREIEGPLVQPSVVPPGLVHEVRLGGRRVALGADPDAGVNRSFSNIGSPGPREHHLYQLPSYDFFVRVPRDQLAGVDLSQLTIDAVQLESTIDEPLDDQPLTDQAALRVTPVASLRGLRVAELPEPVQRIIGPR
jgi:hypothetical protein